MTEDTDRGQGSGCCGNGPREHQHHDGEDKSCCGPEAGSAAGEQPPHGHRGHHGGPGGGGCCGHAPGQGHHGRMGMRMATPEERIARLEAYLQDLRAEAAMVEARITELKAS